VRASAGGWFEGRSLAKAARLLTTPVGIRPQFGSLGIPKIFETKSHGFPDIEVGGPGTCFPVLRYNGKQYDIAKDCPQGASSSLLRHQR